MIYLSLPVGVCVESTRRSEVWESERELRRLWLSRWSVCPERLMWGKGDRRLRSCLRLGAGMIMPDIYFSQLEYTLKSTNSHQSNQQQWSNSYRWVWHVTHDVCCAVTSILNMSVITSCLLSVEYRANKPRPIILTLSLSACLWE